MSITLDFAPRLMPAPQAAHYLGISVTMLRSQNLPRRIIGSKRLYDRYDLDRFASELPTEGGTTVDEDRAHCDALFGLSNEAGLSSREEILARFEAGLERRKAKKPKPIVADRRRPFTPETLAERWRCSAETILSMIRGGELSSVRIGRAIRIPADVVDAHEANGSTAHDGR